MRADEAAQRLTRILARRDGIIPDPNRLDALLRDYFPGERGYVEVLLSALREGIPGRLRSDTGTPRQVLRTNLERLLHSRSRIDTKSAAWAVSVWAAALGIDLGMPTPPPKPTPPSPSPTPPSSPTPLPAPAETAGGLGQSQILAMAILLALLAAGVVALAVPGAALVHLLVVALVIGAGAWVLLLPMRKKLQRSGK